MKEAYTVFVVVSGQSDVVKLLDNSRQSIVVVVVPRTVAD
jgi:hypothetical protein